MLSHLNVQSINNKTNALEVFLHENKVDIFCATEHWLVNEEIKQHRLEGYIQLSNFSRKTHCNGGSVIFGKTDFIKRYNCENVMNIISRSIELHFECSAIVINKKLCVLCIYRSPSSDFEIFITQLTTVLTLVSNKFEHKIIVGDLNINNKNECYETNTLRNVFKNSNVFSCNVDNVPTRYSKTNDSVIDYIVTDINFNNFSIFDPMISDHTAQLLEFKINFKLENESKYILINRITDEKLYHFQFLYKQLVNKPLVGDNFDNIDNMYNVFYSQFSSCYDTCFIPELKCIKQKNTRFSLPWYDTYLKKLSCKLKDLHFLYKNIKDDNLLSQIRTLKKEYNNQLQLKKFNYYNDKVNFSSNKTKAIWNLVNNSKKCKSCCSELVINNTLVTDKTEIVNHFANHFSSVAEIARKKLGVISSSCTHDITSLNSMSFVPVSGRDVEKIIDSMKCKPSTGFDEISVKVVKYCKYELSDDLASLINRSVELGQFPSLLKKAIVIPIHKKLDPKDVNNYRPISLLSVFSKIIEKAISVQLNSFLNKFNKLTNCQHGFRSDYSTESALIEITQYIYDNMDKNHKVMAAFFDLNKAFDTLDFNFILDKMYAIGIRGSLLDWFKSFLEFRKAIVKMYKHFSEEFELIFGIAQGSTIGPLIFLLFINDLPLYITLGIVFMFADDTGIVVIGKNSDECIYKLNAIIEEFANWCNKNNVILNKDKTVLVEFCSKHGTKSIQNFNYENIENSTKTLGVHIDSNMSWEQHINYVINKLNSAYYAICSLKCKLDQNGLLSVYYGLVNSHLNYCTSVWGGSIHINKVLVVQKRILRKIFNMKLTDSCRPVFVKYKIMTVIAIYIYKLLIFAHERQHKMIHNKNIHSHDTRTKNNIIVNKFYHEFYKKSVNFASIHLYNKLTNEIKLLNHNHFCKAVKNILTENCFYSLNEFVVYLN